MVVTTSKPYYKYRGGPRSRSTQYIRGYNQHYRLVEKEKKPFVSVSLGSKVATVKVDMIWGHIDNEGVELMRRLYFEYSVDWPKRWRLSGRGKDRGWWPKSMMIPWGSNYFFFDVSLDKADEVASKAYEIAAAHTRSNEYWQETQQYREPWFQDLALGYYDPETKEPYK